MLRIAAGSLAVVAATFAGYSLAPTSPAPETPKEMVATYNTLADVILGAKNSEHNLVVALLAGTYVHAEGRTHAALAKLKAGQSAKEDLEAVAAMVAQLGTEGDNAVGAVRKRLLEGGHHHNAAGEAKGLYDEGYVVVTRAAKKAFLDAAAVIGRSAGAATADAVMAEWAKVKAAYDGLPKSK